MTYTEQLRAVVAKLDSDGADSEEEWAANILRALGINPPTVEVAEVETEQPDVVRLVPREKVSYGNHSVIPLLSQPKPIPYKDKEQITLNQVLFEYDDYYKRLQRVGDDTSDKIQILCPCCHGACFTISYGNYECIANCSCGHSMTVYDG